MVKIGYVYWKDKLGGEIGKQVIETDSYGYTIGQHGEWEMVIAAEDKEVKKNELVEIKIIPIELPPKAIVLPCFITRHALGLVSSLTAVGSPKKVEERRYLDLAIFLPLYDGTVCQGEYLATVNIFYASVERRLARGAAEKWLTERYKY